MSWLRERLRLAALLLVLLVPVVTLAQPTPSASTSPAPPTQPGRSPPAQPVAASAGGTTAAAASSAPAPGRGLPPGHPDTTAARSDPHADPHTGLNMPRDQVTADSSLPAGSIAVSVANAQGEPLENTQVRLGKVFQSIAEGDQRTFETKPTGHDGQVTFSGLETSSSYSYRVTVRQGAAEYASPPFQLPEDKGQRVLLHVYPATSEIKNARVAMRGLVYVQPRDDVFQFEVWYQVYNLGQVAWVPNSIGIDLPADSKAFTARESMADTRVEADGDGRAKLLGTFAPGQHDVRFAFQVPNEQQASADFYMSLLPHVGEFRVIAEAAKDMTLSVRDFPSVQTSTGMQGERVLVTQKRAANLSSVHITLGGLPTRGQAPWLAVLIAAATAASGLFSARGSSAGTSKQKKLRGDMQEAKSLIVAELVALETAQARGELGPTSYEQTRRALITALARILQPAR